jgi:hypothetical protein
MDIINENLPVVKSSGCQLINKPMASDLITLAISTWKAVSGRNNAVSIQHRRPPELAPLICLWIVFFAFVSYKSSLAKNSSRSNYSGPPMRYANF